MLAQSTTSILFVCLGNICRSPTAEAIMRSNVPDLSLDSAGTSGWHIGDPPYAPMVAAAAKRGFDLSELRGRKVHASDFRKFHLIVAMDQENAMRLERIRPESSNTPVKLLLEFAQHTGLREIPDPYYTRDFDTAIDLITAGCAGLKASLIA